MKKLILTLAVALSFSTLSLTGCGGRSEEVIKPDPDQGTGLTDQQAADYEAEMTKNPPGGN